MIWDDAFPGLPALFRERNTAGCTFKVTKLGFLSFDHHDLNDPELQINKGNLQYLKEEADVRESL